MKCRLYLQTRFLRKWFGLLCVVVLTGAVFAMMFQNMEYRRSMYGVLYFNQGQISNVTGLLQNHLPRTDTLLADMDACVNDDHLSTECKTKLKWMKTNWKTDPCYAAYGVDGTPCSFRKYLSEVEDACPLLANRTKILQDFKEPDKMFSTKTANINYDLSTLLSKLQMQTRGSAKYDNYAWMKTRIKRMWPQWVAGAANLKTQNKLHPAQQKKVLVHMGFLSHNTKMNFAENAFKGGPLGELVQWSDIISALHILGHDLHITSEVTNLKAFLTANGGTSGSSCPSATSPLQTPDIIYSDIMGVKHLKTAAKGIMTHKSCILRVIDSFGTEPSFNYGPYATSHQKRTTWGMLGLKPQQFYTMFPHSPDNSFMGFVVASLSNNTHGESPPERLNQALVYGKSDTMWKDKWDAVNVFHKHLEIHGTVYAPASGTIPSYVKNHGLLNGEDLMKLLQQSKIFIGLGFPYEGPAPLEAIAQGCVFINPKLDPPHNSVNTKFFKGKPTLRKLTSQHPYAEEFIGEPHVITVDINNHQKLEEAINKALEQSNSGNVSPYLPYEYTEEGMLQRLHLQILHQNFCRSTVWPPEDAINIILGKAGKSCQEVCWEKDLLCEPSHFPRLNTESMLNKHLLTKNCSSTSTVEDIYMPAFKAGQGQCQLQKQPLLYSCVGSHHELRRLCPCRDYIRGQTALCTTCV